MGRNALNHKTKAILEVSKTLIVPDEASLIKAVKETLWLSGRKEEKILDSNYYEERKTVDVDYSMWNLILSRLTGFYPENFKNDKLMLLQVFYAHLYPYVEKLIEIYKSAADHAETCDIEIDRLVKGSATIIDQKNRALEALKKYSPDEYEQLKQLFKEEYRSAVQEESKSETLPS